MQSLAHFLHNKFKTYLSLNSLRIGDDQVSYDDLNINGLKIASLINELGVYNETIGVVGQRNFTSYFSVLGIIYSGCNYTPISFKFNESKILSIINSCKIKILIGSKSDIDKVERILFLNKKSHNVKYLIHDEDVNTNNIEYLKKYSFIKQEPLIEPLKTKKNNLLYILYTSGSTGNPKGVMVTNNNVLSYLKALHKIWIMTPGFRASQFHEFNFDPSVSDLFFTWSSGGVLCVVPENELLMPFDFIIREKIQIWSSVPTVANFLLKMKMLKPGIFPSIIKSRFAGEPFSQELANAWSLAANNSTIENHYGPTESTVDVCRYVYSKIDKDKSFSNSIIPIGKPLFGNKILIINKNQEVLENGKIGEIIFKGPQVTNGYLNDSTKTKSSFVSFNWDDTNDIWYKSGDLGFYNFEGNLECLGRIDNQIKFGGRRVEIGEIESAFRKFDKTKDAKVIAMKDDNNIVKGLYAFITDTLSEQEEKEIKFKIQNYIEKLFVPKKIISIEKFPLTVSGKIDRKKLEEQLRI